MSLHQETDWEVGEDEFASYEVDDEAMGEMDLEGNEDTEVDSEVLEAELTEELMEITSEEELDQFLGNVFRSAVRGVGNFARSATGQALGGVLKGVARQALPWVGRAAGGFVGGPVGAAAGGALGSLASRLFETADLEGVADTEVQQELASRYVQLARAAAQRAARAPRGTPPRRAAQQATIIAARRYLPGLVHATAGGRNGQRRPVSPARKRPVGRPGRGRSSVGVFAYEPDSFDVIETSAYGNGNGPSGNGRKQSGRWVRRGGKIVVLGA